MKNNQTNLSNYFLCSYILEQQKKETEHETKLALSGGIMYVQCQNQNKCIYLPKNPVAAQDTNYLSMGLQ
jgi:hypothetical protein